MKAASAVFQGCLRDVELDQRVIGLPEVLETVDIRPGCVWDFPCVENPCGPGELCTQDWWRRGEELWRAERRWRAHYSWVRVLVWWQHVESREERGFTGPGFGTVTK